MTAILSAFILISFLLLSTPFPASALAPKELLIIANTATSESTSLARYYMKRRAVPDENLLQVNTSKREDLSREDYDKEIALPVRNYLSKHDPEGKKFSCIVLMYGIPLRILPTPMTGEEKTRLAKLRKRSGEVEKRRKTLGKGDEQQDKELREEEGRLQRQIQETDKSQDGASVDSELALVMEKQYKLRGWLANRLFLGFRGKKVDDMPQRVILVSRLDGPKEAVVRRIIDDSIEAERDGLKGTAYFDARWPEKGDKDLSAYALYDRAIHNTARILQKSNIMPVVLDEREELFQPGKAPDAALYCGWYSLAKYVDAFTWSKGAVGFHVASAECTTLKNPSSTVWCKAMLEKGIAATVGPVAEPYLQSFPQPEIFFGCIIDGRFTLAECYALSNPFLSWQMVLIGDPLYRPFSRKPRKDN